MASPSLASRSRWPIQIESDNPDISQFIIPGSGTKPARPAQPRAFSARLQLLDARPQRRGGGLDLRQREPGRDVLGAVPVEGLDADQQTRARDGRGSREPRAVLQDGIVTVHERAPGPAASGVSCCA